MKIRSLSVALDIYYNLANNEVKKLEKNADGKDQTWDIEKFKP